jgi:phenylacetate-CoA ligase
MVYLFGRGKFSASLFGITLFPEYFKQVLDSPALSSLVTGRFIAVTEENERCGQQLRLRVELRPGSTPDGHLEQTVRETFIRELPRASTEYRHLLDAVSERAHPHVTLHEFGDPAYFPSGIVRKTS